MRPARYELDPAAHLIAGQPVSRVKLEVAKTLRHQATDAENALWHHLRRSQLAGLHFRRQQVIDGLIVDFYCHSARLAVEVDGPVHESQREYDAERDRALRLRGVQLIRVTNEQVADDIPSVLQIIANAAKSSRPLPPSLQGRGPGG